MTKTRIDERFLLDIAAPTPEQIDAYIMEAHRMRSRAFGQGIRALFRGLLKPFRRKAAVRPVGSGGAIHST